MQEGIKIKTGSAQLIEGVSSDFEVKIFVFDVWA